jgi:hypothetical protein
MYAEDFDSDGCLEEDNFDGSVGLSKAGKGNALSRWSRRLFAVHTEDERRK